MAVKGQRGPLGHLLAFLTPTRGSIRSREKQLILLILGCMGFIWFGAVWFLPEKAAQSGGKVKIVDEVRKKIQGAVEEIVLPPPPDNEAMVAAGGKVNPNIKHGVIDKPDPHRVAELENFQAQIELDEEIEKIRKNQETQVLAKPNLYPNQNKVVSTSSQKSVDVKNEFAKPEQQSEAPVITGGQDKDSVAAERRDYVKQMMVHAWENYVKYAWGKNELRPVSMRGHSASIFGSASMGATIVDAMDTLYIMGMDNEFKRGREWINSQLDMNKMTGDVSVFETNIRYVGGMLTLYSFTGDPMFKEKAVHIVDKLLPAFNTATGIPYALVNMQTGSSKNFGWASGGSSILSEFGTLHMEFTYLSDITGNPIYKEKVDKIRNFINKQDRPAKLYPNYLHPKTGKWGQQHTSVGALGDSFYEYLLKEWLRSGKKDDQAKEMFDEAAKDIEDKLVKVSPHGLTYIAEMKYNRLEHKMDHLACFAGGMYGMAAHNEKDSNSDRWMKIAEGITNTCHESYDRSDTKLGPEAFRFTESSEAKALKQNEKYYILRPETFESYFIMWRLTKNQKYRDWGWEAVQAIENSCKVDGGYTGVRDVYQVGGMKDDVQQSFFLAETLKYLYLLFSDDSLIDMDQWVFNTEAHPLPIRGANNFYRPHSDKQS